MFVPVTVIKIKCNHFLPKTVLFTSRYLSEYYILGITDLANLGSRRVISSGSHWFYEETMYSYWWIKLATIVTYLLI